jgi:tRNA-Thr(GGU) m(6)t(6)A37 methyltransferase TsaA
VSHPAVTFQPVGVVRSPFAQAPGTPLQNFAAAQNDGGLVPDDALPDAVVVDARGGRGTLVVDAAWEQALKDLEGFDRVWVIFHIHQAKEPQALVVPFRDTVPRGVFATRAPARPNAIGMSAVRLLGVTGCHVHVAELDVLDGSPLLDIKPYIPAYDSRPDARSGWLAFETARPEVLMADGRFAKG